MPHAEAAAQKLALARAAYDRGDALLQLQLDVSVLVGQKSSWGSADNMITTDDSVGYFLSEVERIGWRLEHSGFAFVQSGATSSQRMWGTGEGVVNHGAVAGYYVFRRSPVTA